MSSTAIWRWATITAVLHTPLTNGRNANMTSMVISAGHGKYVRGASGILDEVDEARRVVSRLVPELMSRGVATVGYWDDVSTSQQENLERIVAFHNDQPPHDLDVSIHFNAFEQTSEPRGTEVLYLNAQKIAAAVSEVIADSGLIDRGDKYNDDLYFLNNTIAPAILVEVCFVDSVADAEIYNSHFDLIVEGIADVLSGQETIETEPPPLFKARGHCSYFGGPNDLGVDSDEGLAFIDSVEDAPQLFLPYAPDGTSGLARRLNPYTHYLACRWDYDVTPKSFLLEHKALVRNPITGVSMLAFPADWGPHEDTGRIADLSPSLLVDLRLRTDSEVEVIFPFPGV
jgi:N-acetylmuramoyl-L-alanine amidase